MFLLTAQKITIKSMQNRSRPQGKFIENLVPIKTSVARQTPLMFEWSQGNECFPMNARKLLDRARARLHFETAGGARRWVMLILRNIFFTVLLPGTVTVVIPHFILSARQFGPPESWAAWRWPGLLPISIGAGILFWCIWDFAVAGGGTLAPIDPPKHLVVRGLYRYVRNPMYVGVISILLGESLFFASLRLLCYAFAVFCIVHLFVLLYEEPTLRRRFGESYDAYRQSVRRWWPRKPK
jgi:protein-S-isoprenylcysteine O-methyltransferase Ste14